eukprot:6833439-Alexandrium_andersonii.AAC.1
MTRLPLDARHSRCVIFMPRHGHAPARGGVSRCSRRTWPSRIPSMGFTVPLDPRRHGQWRVLVT